MSPSPLSNFINVLVAPGEAFASIRQKPAVVYPMLAVLAAWSAAMLFYFSSVDFAWLVDDMVSMVPADTPEDAKNSMRQAYETMGPNVFAAMTMVQGTIAYLAVWAISAGYLSIISAVKNDGIRFSQWLALECWSAVPLILVAIALAVNVLVSDGQLGLMQSNPLTLNNLLFDMPVDQLGVTALATIHLGTFWIAGLKIFGYSQWTGRSLASAALIILIPYVVWFGGMLAIGLLF